MTPRPTAAACVFPYDHPTVATVWSREAAALARAQMRALADVPAVDRAPATRTPHR